MKYKLLFNLLMPFATSNTEGKTFRNLLALVMVVVGVNGVMGQNTSNFNDGYLSVFKVTSGATLTNTATAVVIEEYAPSGASQLSSNYSFAFPATSGPAANQVCISGTATSAGHLTRSENGRYLAVPGYFAALGAANNNFTTNGTVRLLNGSGTIGSGIQATTLWMSGTNNLRGAATDDGTNYWLTGGSTGIQHTNTPGTVTTVSTTATNTRNIQIYNGQLYFSTAASTLGVWQLGSGKPTSASTTATNLFTTTANCFSVSPDGLTIYAINTSQVVRFTYSGTYNTGTFTYSGGAWSAASTGFTCASASALAVNWTGYSFNTGANGAIIFACNSTTLVTANDNGIGSMTTTTLSTISGNNAFRGLSFSPIKQTISKGGSTPAAGNITKGSSNTVLFQMNLSADEGNSTVKKIVLATAGTAVLGTDISNFRILNDANNDGVADAGEISAGFTTTGTISGSNIIFSGLSLGSYITQGSSKNFLIIGDVSAGATATRTFIPSIASNNTINSIDYTSNITNAGGSLVTMGTSTNAPTGNTLTIVATSNDWIGANGNWNTAANWSFATVPSSSDHVTISSGSPVLDVDYTLPVGKTLTLSGTGGLTINPGKVLTITGTANFGGMPVTFKSDITGTAMLGTSTGTLSGATNVKVERYIPLGKRAFRLLSPAVTTTTFILGNWQLATHITGTSGASGGFDATETNNPSMFTYDNQAAQGVSGWTPIPNTNNTNLIAGVGYRVLIRGDKTPANITSASANEMNAAITLSATGTLRTGPVALSSGTTPAINNTSNITTNGYSLVGNPYQSAVDWHLVTRTGIEDTYYAWDPNRGTGTARGNYVSYNFSSGNSDINSQVGRYIQPGQAFFVMNTTRGTEATLTFQEAHKATTSANVFRTVNTPSLGVALYDPNELAIGGYPIDATKAVFSSEYTNELGLGDAAKLEAAGENIAWFRNNTKLAIDAAAPVTTSDELAMKTIRLGANKNYTFKIQTTNFDNAFTPYLVDTFLNTQTEIATSQAFLASFATTSNQASYSEDRFKIVFQTSALSADDFVKNIKLYPNPAKAGGSFYIDGITEATVSVYNVVGQNIPVTVMSQGSAIQVTPSASLSKGVYLVSITTQGITKQVKWIVE